MIHKIFTSIDLELNQPSNSIIEIGAVVGNIDSGEILHKESIYVDPGEFLNPEIIQLTGIKQETVNAGFSLPNAYSRLCEIHKMYDSFCNPIVWGSGDLDAIKKQMLKHVEEYDLVWPFGRRVIDVKTLYVSHRIAEGKAPQGGLAKAMTKYGLAFKGRKHCGSDDALNTFVLYKRMLEYFRTKGE